MKFTAKALDLDLELTTLKGEVVSIEGPKSINATAAAAALEKIGREDEEVRKGEGPEHALNIVAQCLSGIYGRDPEWWKEEFDYATLSDVRRYFYETLAGIKKKEPN